MTKNSLSERDREKIGRALDALALALADHGHVWSEELRSLYEGALALLNYPVCCMGSDLSASEISGSLTPSSEQRPQSDPA